MKTKDWNRISCKFQTISTLFLLAVFLRSKKRISFVWFEVTNQIWQLLQSVMVPMMLLWSWQLMLVLEFLVKKVSRQQGVPTMQLVNSNSWKLFCSSMEEKPTEEIHTLFFTTSTKTFSMLLHSSTLVSGVVSQANSYMIRQCINCTI